MVRPSSTAEVAATVRLAQASGIPLVPQGGNTGLVGGAVPFEEDGAVLLSLERLNEIREVDALDYSITG